MPKPKYDFAGWATKNDITCQDGRVIRENAFKHDDGRTVPLVWQHGAKKDPSYLLGHAILHNRPEGVYAECYFNDSEAAKSPKSLVMHSAIKNLSIWATDLVQSGRDVLGGTIKEVSLVMGGANPGALIDDVNLSHGSDDFDGEVYIYTDCEIVHGDMDDVEELEHEDPKDPPAAAEVTEETYPQILETLSDKQKQAVGYLMEAVIDEEEDVEDPEDTEDTEDTDKTKDAQHSEGDHMTKKNVFDGASGGDSNNQQLTHADFKAVMEDARKRGSFREAFMHHMESNGFELTHAGTYGLDNIGVLFPDARSVTPTPEWIKRDTGWVGTVINGTRHTPFSRIKSLAADITPDEARAKGYVTGDEKTEEVFALLTRSTTPQTIYKKQKLDRDDILDITDFDVVAWLRAEMRMMLDEEIGRAVLIGDGRAVDSPDKINPSNIRPIMTDAALYAHKVELLDDTPAENIDEIVRAFKDYKGSGAPTLFVAPGTLVDLLLLKDTLGRRIYNTVAELAAALRVKDIVEVEIMDSVVYATDKTLFGIAVNLNDYTIGADKGGDINAFDDFDIDYNQYKYLIETRISGALTKPKSALVFYKADALG